MEQPLKILLLEDSSTDAEMIKRLLLKEKMKCEFHLTMNKKGLVEALETFSPDIILSDNSMPKLNATEALKITRELLPHIPFILITGTVSEEFAVNIIKQGADDYILKDRLTRLPAAIEASLRHRQSEKDNILALQNLIRSEEKYRLLIQRITDAFIALDKNWRYTYLNKQAGELLHRNTNDLIGKNVWNEFPDAVGSATYEAFHRAMQEQRYISNIDYYPPLDLWQENHIYPSKEGLSIFIRDITQKKKAEEDLISNELRFRTLTTNAPVGIFQTDVEGKTNYVNEAWLRITDLPLDEAMGDGWQTVVHPEDKEIQRSQWQEKSAMGLESSSEFRLIDKKGNTKWVMGKATPLFNKDHQITGYIGTLADITEIKILEAELIEQQKREQIKITATALEAQEKERNAIGQELHDNVNQILVGTKMILSMAKHKPEEAGEIVATSMTNLQNAIDENRKIAHELVTPDFVAASLVEQLTNLTDIMLKSASIDVYIDTTGFMERILSDEHKLTIYRIAQEQCTNIVKYAEAGLVNISLSSERNVFKMVIADDGKGMKEGKKTEGIGLKNIKGRLSIFNGTININTAPGKGFILEVAIPLKK